MCQTPTVLVVHLVLANPEIFWALQRGSSKRRAWQQTHRVGKVELMEPGCAGAGSQDLPLTRGWIQPCLSTVGVPIWISALQSGPSPARGISGDAVPRAGEGANEQRQDNEAGKGFLYFRAQEEILQLVNLDTISVHFSLCNQPICSSLRISRARPIAGRCLPGTVFIPVCHGHSRHAENKARSEPGSACSAPRRARQPGPGWGSPGGAAANAIPANSGTQPRKSLCSGGRAASPKGFEQFKGIAVTHR